MVLMLDIKLNNIQFHLMDLAGGNPCLSMLRCFLLITISVKLSYTNILYYKQGWGKYNYNPKVYQAGHKSQDIQY